MKEQSLLQQIFWPQFPDEASARAVARNGMVACFTVALMMALFMAVMMVPFTPFTISEVVIYIAIGIGIRFMSKVAAAAALSLYLGEQIFAMMSGGIGKNAIMIVLFVMFFLNALRAVLAYEKMKTEAPEPSPLATSTD